MKVSIVSIDKNTIAEFREKISVSFDELSKDMVFKDLPKADVYFFPDLEVENKVVEEVINAYPESAIIVNTVGRVLETFPNNGNVLGMNLLPTFINRSLAEVSGESKLAQGKLEELGWEIRKVESRVGMITPRVIFMIINEAYYTVQEGTASKEDIDIGMKLGTNYPHGPFDWSQKIGLINIYKTLDAIYNDTKEGRYKICPLLKQECLT